MSVLVDHQIRALSVRSPELTAKLDQLAQGLPFPVSVNYNQPLLEPFVEGTQGGGVVSYGLTSAGYDLRLGHKVLIFKNTFNELMDPKRLKRDEEYLKKVFDSLTSLKDGQQVILPPHSYLLAYSLEYIRIPNWLKGTCVGKSTYARCGILVNTTPLEPGWHGNLTIEIGNISPCPVPVYVGEGIAQLEFHRLDGVPEIDYAKKDGKYQGQQAEPVPGKVKE